MLQATVNRLLLNVADLWALLLWLVYAVMLQSIWPSRSYLLGTIASPPSVCRISSHWAGNGQ